MGRHCPGEDRVRVAPETEARLKAHAERHIAGCVAAMEVALKEPMTMTDLDVEMRKQGFDPPTQYWARLALKVAGIGGKACR